MISIVAFSFLIILVEIYTLLPVLKCLFHVHGSLEANISPKTPSEVSFLRVKNNLFTV